MKNPAVALVQTPAVYHSARGRNDAPAPAVQVDGDDAPLKPHAHGSSNTLPPAPVPDYTDKFSQHRQPAPSVKPTGPSTGATMSILSALLHA